MEAKQTPLIELLESIPQDARLVVEHDRFSSSVHNVGRLAHEAAGGRVGKQGPLHPAGKERGDVMPLILRNCNPDPEALARGLEAAHAVLAAAGITPEYAWENCGYHAPWVASAAMQAWYRAEDAAIRAAFGSWRAAPLTVAMEWEADPPSAEPAP